MPHTNSVLVHHPNGTFFAQRSRVEHLTETKPPRAYWRDLAKTNLVILSSSADAASDGYEYGGKRSLDRFATVTKIDPRTGVAFETAAEKLDRTQTPVRLAGGQKVLQLKPLSDRRTAGYHVSRQDKLWRPERKRA
jgi:hypothetical protein